MLKEATAVPSVPPYTGTTEGAKRAEIAALFALPFPELLLTAMQTHRAHFNPLEVQAAALLSVKTGKCPEDCKYCAQSVRFDTPVESTPLMDPEEVRKAARAAKAQGASRFCMGAGWRRLRDRDMPAVVKMIRAVKEEGLESCVTLGMAEREQIETLRDAGLDYYNHNIDTSPEYYREVITTRTFADRLETLQAVREAGVKVCCGGIVGMGETREDRIAFLATLAAMDTPPESVPVNRLVPIKGTPLEDAEPIEDIEFVRTVAVARIAMPSSYVRLSAGREGMSDVMQALCFAAGANSIFYGETLLTAANPAAEKDKTLLASLGMYTV